MKKLVKILVGIVIAGVALLLVVVLTLPLTIGPIVKTAASVGGPKALGVSVSVGDVKLSPLSGSLVISQVKVGNPKGYSEKDAFAVDKVEVGLNIKSLLSDTILIKKIQIDAPAISFESKDGKSNFDAMLSNAKKSSEEEKAKKSTEKKAGKKVVIEVFSLNNGKVSYASALTMGKALTIPLPSVTLHDIGKKSGGTSFVDALTEVMNGILGGVTEAVAGAAGAAGDLLKGFGGSASNALKGATGGAKDAASDAVNAAENAAKSAGDAAKDVGKSLKKLFR
jgi:uncharacterized protein involved in outer membrane biogenesis